MRIFRGASALISVSGVVGAACCSAGLCPGPAAGPPAEHPDPHATIPADGTR